LHDLDLSRICLQLKEEVRSIGRRLVDVQPQEIKRQGRDVTTDLDVAISDRLRQSLLKIVPGSSVVTEEDSHRRAALPESAPAWLVDPIDGTGNLLTRYPVFATSVALFAGGETVLGVIYNPNNDEMFHAVARGGAFLNDVPISVTSNDDIYESLVSTALPLDDEERLGSLRLIEGLSPFFRDIRIGGSAVLELAYVACGRLDCYFESRLAPWDVAAGRLLVAEAGGTVIESRKVIVDNIHRADIVAANPVLADKWRRKISELHG